MAIVLLNAHIYLYVQYYRLEFKQIKYRKSLDFSFHLINIYCILEWDLSDGAKGKVFTGKPLKISFVLQSHVWYTFMNL